ncbi:MAG: enoyl-CoA hydratase [Beijerinckiaceae bacterium]
MSEPTVDYGSANGIAVVTLNQPARLNAMTYDMWRAMPACIARAEADPSVRVIVLTGAGEKAFCAGADISQFGEKRTGEEAVKAYEQAVSDGMAAVSNASKPVVARIRGYAFGGGLALALCCDLRISSSDSRFRIPAARLGLGYAFANIEALVHRIGLGPTSDLLLSARIVDGAEAERLGLVNKMWPTAEFETKAGEYIGGIAKNAPLTLRAVKQALSETAKSPSDRDRATVDELVAACFASDDYREGQLAFKEKRDPVFRGK